MDLAHTLIIETGRKVYRVALRVPLDLFEIWHRFATPGRRPVVTLAMNGVARVSFV